MKRPVLIAAALMAAAMMSGCVGYGSVYALRGTGFIFTHVREPLMENLHNTHVPNGRRSQGTMMEVAVSGVRVNWADNSIGSIAKAAGLKTLYYADIQRTSVLGIWKSQTVYLYGEKDDSAAARGDNLSR